MPAEHRACSTQLLHAAHLPIREHVVCLIPAMHEGTPQNASCSPCNFSLLSPVPELASGMVVVLLLLGCRFIHARVRIYILAIPWAGGIVPYCLSVAYTSSSSAYIPSYSSLQCTHKSAYRMYTALWDQSIDNIIYARNMPIYTCYVECIFNFYFWFFFCIVLIIMPLQLSHHYTHTSVSNNFTSYLYWGFAPKLKNMLNKWKNHFSEMKGDVGCHLMKKKGMPIHQIETHS